MAEVILQNITKVYKGDVKAVDNINIHIKDKEICVLVGPSGCGKSTLLRMIAGLETISNGEIFIDGQQVNEKNPKDRDVAMVFPNYAIYPHMSVFENMAFGLRVHKYSQKEIQDRVKHAAQLLDIESLLQYKPKALSGGQRQRVAVGRAIVRNPKVLLFDEPLSNLDSQLRIQMRTELATLHHRLESTIIYVTHDQSEAMTISDKIVVLKDGLVQQIGAPLSLYNQPINWFVASFIGTPSMNIMTVMVRQQDGHVILQEDNFSLFLEDFQAHALRPYLGRNILLGIRPQDLKLQTHREAHHIIGSIQIIEPLGFITHLWVRTTNYQLVAAIEPHYSFRPGDKVYFFPDRTKVHFFDIETEKSILFNQ